MAKSSVEIYGLQYEAERLVRSGESRAEVSRMLNVHPQTLAGWALRGGWRKKDLDIERSAATTKRVIRNLAVTRGWEAEKHVLLAEQRRLMREAIAMIAAGDAVGLAGLLAQAGEEGMEALPALEPPPPDRLASKVAPLGERLPGSPPPPPGGEPDMRDESDVWED